MNKKSIIILGIVIGIYLLVSFSINYYVNKNKIYIVFPDNINLQYQSKWSTFSDTKLLDKQYTVIQNGNIMEQSKLSLQNGIIIGNQIELENDIIAYQGSNIKEIPYITEELTESDYSYIVDILRTKNIDTNLELVLSTKYTLDLNGDGLEETIYTVSNNYDTEIGKLFSIVILKEKNQIIEFSEFDSEYEVYIPYLYFVDIYKDGYVDVIIKNVYASLRGQNIKVLQFKEDLFYDIVFEEEIK